MKYKKKVKAVFIMLVLVICIAYAFESYFEMIKMQDKVIRLHILANSDTLNDQNLKLKVRNNIINSFSIKFKNIASKDESEKVVRENINKIREIAQKTVYDEGYYYDVKVYYEKYELPEKEYETYTLPKGSYDTVRVEIGEANGKNWWCVMFPPLCFTSIGQNNNDNNNDELDEKLREVLTEEEIKMIKTHRGYSKITLKSKLYELIYNAFHKAV